MQRTTKNLLPMLPRTTLLSSWKTLRPFSSTVDKQEIKNFQKFTTEWWDQYGPFKPLHSMNKIRIPFITDGLKNTGKIPPKSGPCPLENVKILDVGCGGGILCEPLAKLGADVTGLDANPDIIEFAKSHASNGKLKIDYVASTIENHASENCEKYDVIVASEVIEHITRKEEFLEACVKCLKPSGSIFLTTINKTTLAGVLVIFAGENILNLIPKGTHQFEKFIEPHKLQKMLENNNCRTHLIHGTFYNFIMNDWYWWPDKSVSYVLHAVKIQSDPV